MRPAGILLLDKPPGPTSHDAVAVVRRSLGIRRVGHFGTLDPFASGLLVCAVGSATRLAPFAAGHDRSYRATVRLGWTSTTDDPEGERTAVPVAKPPSYRAVENASRAWIGEVSQAPPAYSAKHVRGKRAYARARAGEQVVLPEARITIHDIRIVRYAYPDLEMDIRCGPGTYIRALARDLGGALRTGGYCAALRREGAGPFSVQNALPWGALVEPDAIREAILPAEAAIADLPAVELDDAEREAAAQGRAMPIPRGIPGDALWVRLRGREGFIGLAEVRENRWLQPRRILFVEGEDAGHGLRQTTRVSER